MPTTPNHHAYVGTYTDGDSEGIYCGSLDTETDTVRLNDAVDAGPNPSFLAVHPTGEYLYAVNEIEEGSVTALSVDGDTGELSVLNRVVTGGGADPCYCAVDHTGSYVFVAHYTGGTVAVVPLDDDGCVGEPTQLLEHEGSGPNEERQEAAHPHSVRPGPDNEFVYVADLGTDGFYRYQFDLESGTLDLADESPLGLPPGAGPRHFDFHPTEDRIYLLNELDSTLSVVGVDSDTGALELIDSVPTLADGFDGENITADVHVDDDGRHVYASNRGHDSVAVFAIDPDTGGVARTQVESTGGAWPRNFALSPSESSLFVENMESDEIVAFSVDREDGTLDATGATTAVPKPSCLQFVRRE